MVVDVSTVPEGRYSLRDIRRLLAQYGLPVSIYTLRNWSLGGKLGPHVDGRLTRRGLERIYGRNGAQAALLLAEGLYARRVPKEDAVLLKPGQVLAWIRTATGLVGLNRHTLELLGRTGDLKPLPDGLYRRSDVQRFVWAISQPKKWHP